MISDISDELFERAVLCEVEERMGAFPFGNMSEIPQHKFSKGFIKKMQLLQKDAERPKAARILVHSMKRTAMVALVAALLLVTTILSVEAIREEVFRFIAEKFEQYSVAYFEPIKPSSGDQTQGQPFTAYVPTYIPSDFHLVDSDFTECVMLEYENDRKDFIGYKQNYLSGIGMQLNTEGTELKKIQINACEGYYYANRGIQTFIWYDDVYVYEVSTSLSKFQAEKVAKSLEIKEF